MKFLIDECLSPALSALAVKAGRPESAHITYRGMQGWKDFRLMRAVIKGDWTLVTRNPDDFRPKDGSSSQAPCYVGQPLHAGLICLNLPKHSVRKDQQAYFQAALKYIGPNGDLINQVLEVDPADEQPGEVMLRRYDFPKTGV